MSDFLTVEDINSILLNYDKANTLYTFDSSLITSNGTYTYDFLEVTKNGTTWTIKVQNTLWTGGYYVTNTNGEVQSTTGTYSNNTLTITLNSGDKIIFYLSSYKGDDFQCETMEYLTNLTDISSDYDDDGITVTYDITETDGTPIADSTSVTLTHNSQTYTETTSDGAVTFTIPSTYAVSGTCKLTIDGTDLYGYINLTPDEVNATLTGDLIVGKKNTLTVNRDSTLLEQCTVTVYGKTYNVDWSGTDTNKIVVDLSKDNSTTPIKAVIEIAPTDKVQGKTIETSLNRSYLTVSTFNDLKTELESLTGSQYIKLGANITLSSNVNVNHDVIIEGDNKTVNCGNVAYRFTINTNVKAVFNNMILQKVQPVAVQMKQSDFTLRKCTVKMQEYTSRVIGNVVKCDIDHTSLSSPDDFITLIDGCTIERTAKTNLFYHGGILTITDTVFEQRNNNYLDKFPLIMQVDGECVFRNSSAQLVYGSSSQPIIISDLKYWCLFELGEDATFNGQTYDDLMDNNVLNLEGINCWTQIAKCGLSGHIGYFTIEPIDASKPNCLYCLSGIDYVFKANTQIRRLS